MTLASTSEDGFVSPLVLLTWCGHHSCCLFKQSYKQKVNRQRDLTWGWPWNTSSRLGLSIPALTHLQTVSSAPFPSSRAPRRKEDFDLHFTLRVPGAPKVKLRHYSLLVPQQIHLPKGSTLTQSQKLQRRGENVFTCHFVSLASCPWRNKSPL